MTKSFQKTTSNFFVTFLIGLIVVSFMFTGYESMKGAPNAIAKVGPYPITSREYQLEYNRQIAFFQSFTGGKTLSSNDIERFGIKSAVMRNLVQSKLRLIFAQKADITISPEEIKRKIKELEYFQTDGQFDIEKYKGLLRANSLSPKNFEQEITDQIRGQNANLLLKELPFSKGYIDSIVRFKEKRYNGLIIEITDKALRKRVPISNKEVATYLKGKANKARVENLFNERKPTLNIKEKIKASHILINISPETTEAQAKKKIDHIRKKLTPQNFAQMANKYTEDPSGKGKGGDLGYFSPGKMVPEFEKVAFSLKSGSISQPVKTTYGYHIIYVKDKLAAQKAIYKSHEKALAKELIRNELSQRLKELSTKVKEKVLTAVKTKKIKELKKLKMLYGFNLVENAEFNRYDGNKSNIQIAAPETKKIWEELRTKDSALFDFDLAGKIQIVALSKNQNKDLPLINPQKELENIQMIFGNKLRKEVLESIGEKTSVKQFFKL